MKNLLYILVIGLMLLCTSCGNKQKPSQRANVWKTEAKKSSEISLSSDKVSVPFKRTLSGLAEVQVSLNGVPFNMYWDTGASITSISSLELAKLAKENKIRQEDLLGSVTSTYADGSSAEQPVFMIKEIFIQGNDGRYLILKNVETIISENSEAPLLIGQNIISNLPKHSFNESSMVIEFEK